MKVITYLPDFNPLPLNLTTELSVASAGYRKRFRGCVVPFPPLAEFGISNNIEYIDSLLSQRLIATQSWSL